MNPMNPLHKLLLRQLKKRGLEELMTSEIEAVKGFLKDVSDAYYQNDDDRSLLERSMELSSNEMIEANRLLELQRASLIAASKMSTLGEMSSGIAHEINTPLAAITMLASQMKEIAEDTPVNTDLLKSHAEKIENTVQKIAKIVSSLKSFSRNANTDPFIDFKAKDLLNDTLPLCQERFVLQGIHIDIQMQNEQINLQGRPSQLSQVIINLLNNAFDAIVELSDKWIRIEIKEDAENVFITVTDSGPGIPPHVQNKMFQPFFTTKEMGKGTGIGLSISRNILKAHKGELTLNTQCKNTQFLIRVPKVQKAQNGEAA